MQILRRLMLACVAATFLTPILLHAYDNESQIRARQALEDKMKELDAQQPTNSALPQPQPAAPKAKKQKPAKVSKSAKPATQAPEAQKPAPSDILVTPGQPPREVPPEQTAPSGAPAVSQPAPTAPPPVASKPSPAPVATQPAPSAAHYSAPPATSSGETEETEKLREDMRAKMQEQRTKNTATNAPSQANQPWTQPYTPPQEHNPSHQQHVAASSQPSRQATPSLPPLAAPPTGLSAAKQQKLDQLLQLYRADQITPQEYHEQRAKILAEP